MRSYSSILSLFFLSAYALFLLHDLILHTHHDKDNVLISSAVQQNHGNHHHSHEHHGEGEDETPEPFDKSSLGYDLIHAHSHSGLDGHQHNLSYRAASIGKLIPQVDAVPILVKNSWHLPDQFHKVTSNQREFLLPFSNPHLSSGYGLRGPPALG